MISFVPRLTVLEAREVPSLADGVSLALQTNLNPGIPPVVTTPGDFVSGGGAGFQGQGSPVVPVVDPPQ